MVLGKYIRKLFAEKLLFTILITMSICTFIEFADDISHCKEMCSTAHILKKGLMKGILFTNDAIFFIVAISSIWFIFRIITTNQMQIITVYTGSFLFTLKNVIIVILYTCIIYALPLDHFVLSKIKDIKYNENIEYTVQKMWVKDINTLNNTANGHFYLLQNLKQYKTGFLAETMNSYIVSDGYLTNYTHYDKIFITKGNDGSSIFFTLDSPTKSEKKSLENISFYNFTRYFYDNTPTDVESFYTNFKNLMIKLFNIQTQSTVIVSASPIVNTFQICLSMVVAVLIPFTQLLSIKTVRGTGMNKKIIQTMAFLIISYTIFEIVKIIDIGIVANHITSITITLSFALAFLSRFIKIYH